MTKIAVFGSAFNPPTLGHADVIEQLLAAFELILLVPNANHAFGKNMLDFEHRINMLQQMLTDKFAHNPKLIVEPIEQQLLADKNPNDTQAVYSFDLLTALEKKYTGKLHLVLGPDNLQGQTWQRFYRYQDIQQRWQVFAAQQRNDIRSTLAREQLNNNDDQDLAKLLSASVITYIKQQGLYQK